MRILFVCHGNICRSVMAEMIFKSINNNTDIEAFSKALSSEEIGNSIYYKAKETLDAHHIKVLPHKATKVTKEDYNNYDYIYYMDKYNKRNLEYLFPNDNGKKIKPLLEHDIEDPWYTRDFEKCYNDLVCGIKKILMEYNNER